MTTTEQFYVNYEFSDERVNDNGELTEDRVIEMLDAFYKHKTKESDLTKINKNIDFHFKEINRLWEVKKKITNNLEVVNDFYCHEKGSSIVMECVKQCPTCRDYFKD